MGKRTFNKANPAVSQIEVYDDFSGGLNTELADNAVKDNQFRKIVNFDMDKAGSLIKRPGLYKIPNIENLFDMKISEIIRDNIITDNQKPVDRNTLKIKDVIHFFDGKHWVFNYITTWGTFSICLDGNMQIMDDLDISKNETILNTYLSFYPDKKDLAAIESYETKISKYNDIYIMIKSFYAKTVVAQDKKRQVRIYSWNPIKKEVNGVYYKPGWIEAKEVLDDNDLINITDYGTSQTKLITSYNALQIANKAKTFFEFISASKLNNELANIPTDSPFKIYLRETSLGTVLVKEYKQNTYELPLTHFNGAPVGGGDLGQIVFKNSNTLVVYLNTPIKGIDNNTDGVSKKGHANYDKIIFYEVDIPSWKINWDKIKGPNSLAALDYTSNNDYGCLTSCVARYTNSFIDIYSFSIYFEDVIKDIPYDAIYSIKPFHILNLSLAKRKGNNRAQQIVVTEKGIPFYWITEWDIGKKWKMDGPTHAYWYFMGCRDKAFYEHIGSGNKEIYYISSSPIVDNDGTRRWINWVGYCPEVCYANTDPNSLGNVEYYYWTHSIPLKTNPHYNAPSDYKQPIDNFDVDYRNYYYSNNKKWISGPPSFWSQDHRSMKVGPSLLADTFKTIYQNEMLDENTFGFANSHWEVRYKTEQNGSIKLAKPKSAYIKGDIFYLENITKENAKTILKLNNINTDSIDWMSFNDIFGPNGLTLLDELSNDYINGRVVDITILGTFEINGISRVITFNLKEYEYFDFLIAMKQPNSIGVLVEKINNEPKEMIMYWKDGNNNQKELLAINNTNIKDLDNNEREVFNTMRFSISYDFLPNGYRGQTLNFKQQKYIKPNLNDLTYLWYNLASMSMFWNKTYPDIYDPKNHPFISSQLIQYPKSTYSGAKSIELFGIFPVNNLVLQPGKQKFQIFYNAGSNSDTIKEFIAAITAMSVDDYTAMINSPDYSTTGYQNNTDANSQDKVKSVKGPNWKHFESVFTDFDDDQEFTGWNPSNDGKGKKAIFELEIPSTTTPYMVLVQVAQNDPKDQEGQEQENPDNKLIPRLATVSETRIQFQPSSAISTKINILGLFDEYTTSTKLTNYGAHLIVYGNSNKLFFSDTAVPSYFPVSRVIQLPTPEAIQNCIIFQNKLIISTNNSKFYIGGSSFDSSEDPFMLKEISSDSGLLAPKSEVLMGNYLYFLDNSGIKILKNLFGTYEKEFAYESIDSEIKSIVPRDILANGVSYRDKYYLCFPEARVILVYNFNYKCWVMYESQYFNFSNMFVFDDRLFGIDRTNFVIYEFKNDVYVDNWNEQIGYETYTKHNANVLVQKGTPIVCSLETKALDQNYNPHRKKYNHALINANIKGFDLYDEETTSKELQSACGSFIPSIKVDNDLINYKFSIYSDNTNTYHYSQVFVDDIFMYDDSIVNQTVVVDKSTLGDNTNSFYYVPIQRTGNSISFGLEYKEPTSFTLNSISLKYSLRTPKGNKGYS